MADVFTIYDLWGSCSHCVFSWRVEDGDNVICISQKPLHPFLTALRTKDNKKAYVIGEDNIILDDVTGYNGGIPSIDSSKYVTLERILHDLDADPLKNSSSLRSWIAGEQVHFADSRYADERNRLIIPVPDRLTADSQDAVLDAFSVAGRKKTLLWRSVAAFLGNEEELLQKANLQVGDKVVIIDCERTSCTVTNLWIDECDGRLVPAHRLFYSHDKAYDERIIENYPVCIPESYESKFPFRYERGFLEAENVKPFVGTDLIGSNLAGDVAIIVGNASEYTKSRVNAKFKAVLTDESGMSVVNGAAIFASRMNRGIVSYYDECESLSLVVQTPMEEIVFKPLIKANRRLIGGLKIEGSPVDGIYISKTSNNVHFYLGLGEGKPDSILREYIQELEMTEDLMTVVQRTNIELELESSLVAGQGRARVEIVAKDKRFRDIFSDVSLDWQKLQEGRTRNGNPATLSNLEKEMDRTFPVDIKPTMVADSAWCQGDIRLKMKNSIRMPGVWPELNKPKWPNALKFDVSRFDKYNVFGQPSENSDGLPKSPEDKELCIRFFDTLRNYYARYARYGRDESTLKAIAWTYHPDYFREATEEIRDVLLKCTIDGAGATLTQISASFCANMLQSNEDILLFFKAFVSKLGGNDSSRGAERTNNWLRAAYQLLMYNTVFLRDVDSNTIENLIFGLIATYLKKLDSPIIQNNICRTILFLLKRRRFDPFFCKEDVYGESENGYLHAILNYMLAQRDIDHVFSRNMKDEQIEGAVDLFLWKSFHLDKSENEKLYNLYMIVFYKFIDSDHDRYIFFHKLQRMNPRDISEMRECIASTKGCVIDLYAIRERFIERRAFFQNDWAGIVYKYLNGKGNLDIPVGDDE